MKRPFFSLFLLFLVVGGILYFQWVEYATSKEGSESSSNPSATQKITVTKTDATILVEQVVSGLSIGKYKTDIPKGIKDIECIDSASNICEIGDFTEITEEVESIRISYEVAMEGNSYVFEPWIQFPNINFSITKIEVVEPLPFEGEWIAAAPLVGQTHLSTIAYYQFKGEHGSFPLFRTEQTLSKSSNNTLTIYGEGKETSFQSILNQNLQEKLPDFGTWNIILSDYVPSHFEKGFMVLPSTVSNQEIFEALILTYVKEKFQLKTQNQEELACIVGSILVDQEIGYNKTWVYEQIKSNLTEIEWSKLQEMIRAQISKPISPEWLDQQFFLVKGLKTTFVSDSIKTDQDLKLFFFDPRPITSIRNNEDEILSIIEGGLRYYPVKETLGLLNFEVNYSPEKNDISIHNDREKYLFYTDEPIYFVNDEKYGLLQIPITSFNQRLYIEEGWLRRLFHIQISVSDDSIHLSQF